MTAPTQRVEALEAEAFRKIRQIDAVNERLDGIDGRLDHLTGAVGELSGDLREFRHDMREFQHGVEGQLRELAQAQARQDALLVAIAQKLGVTADPA